MQLEVPYDRGIDPLDGLLDLAEEADIVKRSGGWYSYEMNGETQKFQKSSFKDHYMNLFDFDTETEIIETDED